MTNNHLLIETIMTKLRAGAEQYVTSMRVEEDVLNQAEERP